MSKPDLRIFWLMYFEMAAFPVIIDMSSLNNNSSIFFTSGCCSSDAGGAGCLAQPTHPLCTLSLGDATPHQAHHIRHIKIWQHQRTPLSRAVPGNCEGSYKGSYKVGQEVSHHHETERKVESCKGSGGQSRPGFAAHYTVAQCTVTPK